MMEDPDGETRGAARVHVSFGRIAHLAEADLLAVRVTKSSEAISPSTNDNFGFGGCSTGGFPTGSIIR
jgi:hypothetical protein